MRSLTFTILALVVAAGAQTPKPVTPAPKTTTTKASTAPAKTPAKAMPAAKTPAKTAMPAPKTAAKATMPAPKTVPAKSTTAKTHVAAKPVVKAPAQKPAAKPAAAVQKPAEKAIPEVARANRRDPFISPLRLAEERMRTNPACTTGARCLVISQVTLKGVVKTQSGWIAMVENAARKQYNLHEKDTVQNGVVVKITGDSIVFQETVNDPLGRPVTREVVKRVTAPVV